MNLIFYDRQTVPVQPASEALLTIERKDNFSFNIWAVASLKLKATDEVVLAKDADTNTWYLVLQPKPDFKAFELKPRDNKNSKALMFCAQAQARAYYQAHALAAEANKSVRALVSLTPVQYSGMELYPLTPQHPTTAPAAEATPSAPAEVAGQPDVAPLASDLPQLQAEQATPPMVASTPVAVSSVPTLSPGQLPESRGEQLADYWNEREMSLATPAELEEVIKVLGAMPRADRGFTENKVLNQAKTEQAKRVKEAGKGKGGNRG